MKKSPLLFCTVMFLVCLLCGCVALPENNTSYPDESRLPEGSSVTESEDANSKDAALEALQNEINQSGSAVGTAFVGYVDSQSSEVDLRYFFQNSAIGKAYPDFLYASLYMGEGQELYAIVPPNEKGTITVYPSTVTEDGEYVTDNSNPLCVGGPGEVLLLRCNLSEIYSNVMISATDGGGAITFRPSLSMENGHMQKIAGVYDFSIYEQTPDENSVRIASEILLGTDEVKAAVEQGMRLLYTEETQIIEGRPCLLFALGTDRDGQFVRERYYGVCDNLIYTYDVLSDTWEVLGVG